MVETEVGTTDRCPYRAVCPQELCPGDSPAGEYSPVLGFRLVDRGILCVDWDVTIPKSKLENFRIPEGRHVSGLDAADKIDATRRRYSKSPKRREAQLRYEQTDKGKETKEKHDQSEKAKLSKQKYYYSNKGQEAHQRRAVKTKLFKSYSKWLEDNPGKTLTDFQIYLEKGGT